MNGPVGSALLEKVGLCSDDAARPAVSVRRTAATISYLVAEQALHLAFQILGYAAHFLLLAFGLYIRPVGSIARDLLGTAGSLVCDALRLVGQFANGYAPLLIQ